MSRPGWIRSGDRRRRRQRQVGVAVEGWRRTLPVTPEDAVRQLEPFFGEFLYTNIDREGLMQGIDRNAIVRLRNATRRRVTVAGGVTTADEIEWLATLGMDAVVGMALYSGRLEATSPESPSSNPGGEGKSMKYVTKLTPIAAALVCALAIAAAAAAQETEQFDRTVSFHSGGRLKLNTFSGRVTITGSDSNDVVIHAVRRGTRERLDHIQIDVDVDPAQVSIEANKKDASWHENKDNVVDTDFEIQVPRQTELDVNAFSSRVDISGVSGPQKLHTFSGEVRVTGATGAMNAETFSGDIEVAFAGSPSGQIDFDSFSGRITSSRPIAMHSSSRRSRMHGELGSGGDTQFRFKTFSGDVTLR